MGFQHHSGLVEILDAEGTNMNKRTVQQCLNKNDLHGADLRKTLLHKPCHLAAHLNSLKLIWTQKMSFATEYYRVTKQKLSFKFGHNDKKTIGVKIMRLFSQRTLC